MSLKPLTIIYLFLVLSLLSMVYIFENKVNEQNKTISNKTAKISKYMEDILVYEAEWSYQNTPARLSRIMLSMQQDSEMSEAKFHQFADLMNLPDSNLFFAKTPASRKMAKVTVRKISNTETNSVFNVLEKQIPAFLRN